MNLENLKILDEDLAAKGVSSLPTRPNAPVTSGGMGLTPSAMRAKFDELPKHIAGKFNDLIGDLGDRFTNIGGSITNINGSITQFAGDIENQNTTIHQLEENNNAHDNRISNLENHIAPVTKLAEDVKNLSADVDRLGLDLMNLTLFHKDAFVEVEDSYDIRTTADGLNIYDEQNTFVKRIDGASVPTVNLIKTQKMVGRTGTRNGVTYTVLEDGGVHLVGTAKNEGAVFQYDAYADHFIQPTAGKTYTISGGIYGTDSFIVKVLARNINTETGTTSSWIDSDGVTNKTNTQKEGREVTYIALYMLAGVSVDAVVYPMLNEGDTAKPYSLYFDGLQTAKVNKIVSTGRNFIDYEKILSSIDYQKQSNGYWFGYAPEGTLIFKNTGKISGKLKISYKGKPVYISGERTPFIFAVYYTDGGVSFLAEMDEYSTEYATYSGMSDGSKIVDRVFISRGGNGLSSLEIKDIMITWADDETYEQYVEDTYQLPQMVELGKWDYIDVEEGKIYRYTKRLDPTTVEIEETSDWMGNTEFIIAVPDAYKKSAMQGNLHYTAGEAIASDFEYVEAYDVPDQNRFVLVNDELTFMALQGENTEEFRDRISKGDIVYRLAEPISVEDIDTPKSYKAWNGGTETIIGEGGAKNAHANPTITQEYIVRGAEA
jgi:hypothetical protein